MYEVRDVGAFAVMLALLPIFAVIFAMGLVIAAPFVLAAEAVTLADRWWDGSRNTA